MAAMEDDVFFDALQKHCKIIESALMSKCNMNNQVREDARQALGELKASIYKNFERVKSANFLEACKQSLKVAIASQVTPKRSYANVVAPSGVTENKGKSSDYCVVVDSDNCSSEDVKKIIKAKINPAESKLGVCDLKNIRGNKLLVKCVSENDRDWLLTEIQEKSPELKASVPKRRNPAIIVKNVPNEVKIEDLLKVITEQNPEIVVDNESIRQCRVHFTLKTFQHTRHVVIETPPTVRKSILRQTRLKIIWSACDVDDFLIINRCFNCLGYNHRADECNNALACFHCSGEHKGQDCPNRDAAACTNCIRFNHKTKNIHKKVNVNHKPFSECCPCHIFMKKNTHSRINYD
ncbi:gag-like protein [Trichonephila clavipes]|nr:gag-like protein [Trichonephila clavipes]